jgi:hypothetical protein
MFVDRLNGNYFLFSEIVAIIEMYELVGILWGQALAG